MFCENCGTRVDDGSPFCPNCGNKMPVPEAPAAPVVPETPVAPEAPAAPTAPVNPGFVPAADPGYIPPAADPGYIPPAAPAKAPKSVSGLLGKLNAMSVMEKIFFLCTGGLLVLCAFLSLLKVFTAGYGGYPMEADSVFFTRVITVLFTLSITFFVLDYFDWFSFKWLWFFIAGAAATIFTIFVIMWIDSGCRLTFGGWLFLLMQLSLTAAAVMLLIEKLKKK